MRYSTNYDIGDRKRGQGINEDSVSLTVFEEGHRDGYRGQDRAQSLNPDTADDEAVDGTGEQSDTRVGDADDRDSSETDGPSRPMNRSAGVFVVADGAGGHDAGDIASYITTTVVAEQLAPVAIRAARSYPGGFDVDVARDILPDPPGEQELEAAVAEAITAAHREVVRYADETGTQSYTTVVAGIYADGKLHYGWVGDSRAYVVNGVRETISPLTRDHAVVQEWVDGDEIDPVAAHVHPNGNEITRALGGSGYEDPDEATVEVDTRTVRLYAEDTVLATSDGLIDAQTDAPDLYQAYVDSDRSDAAAERIREQVVTDDEIRDVILDAPSLDAASQEFVSLANDRGGKDNISVLLFADSALPDTPESGGMPVRNIDPDIDISERETVIMTDE